MVSKDKIRVNIYLLFHRLKTKKNRENLEEFLLSCDRVTSLTKYYKCEEMFSNLEVRYMLSLERSDTNLYN